MNASVRERIRGFIIARMLQGDGSDFRDDTDLLSTGILDSFGALELATFLQDELKAPIDLAQLTIENLRSVETLARLVERGLADPNRDP